MKFLAIIPARYASTRFPGKPLAMIAGKPMIQRVYERASEVFEHCYVATDDSRIEQAVVAFGGRVVLTRDDHQSGTDRCCEAMQLIALETGLEFDVVVNIQGDEPFIASEQLLQLKASFDDPDTDIATLIKPFTGEEDIFNPNSPKVVVSKSGFALYFSRSVIPFQRGVDPAAWPNSHIYYKHIGLYAYRCAVLREIAGLATSDLERVESLEQLRWLEYGYRIKTSITTIASYGIDTPEDLAAIGELLM